MQAALVVKFLQMAKICKELGNFATCISIKEGLDHILIRHIRVCSFLFLSLCIYLPNHFLVVRALNFHHQVQYPTTDMFSIAAVHILI